MRAIPFGLVSTMMNKHPTAIAGGLTGLLVGDALGVPYEFHAPHDLPTPDQIEFTPPPRFRRSHQGVPPGTWSDDGAQALILLDSLLERGHLDLLHFSAGLRRWLFEGFYAVNRSVFDIGAQTSTALNGLGMGIPPETSGPADESQNGNGSLMRVLPLALWHTGSDRDLIQLAAKQSLPTHGHPRAQIACAVYCLWARGALEGAADPWHEAVGRFAACGADLFPASQIALVLDPANAQQPLGTGYVVSTLWSAKAAIESTDNYEDCVRRAIAFGHDTDTTAAVAGGIAGLLYGVDGIPERWRTALRGCELYQPLLDRLVDHLDAAKPIQIPAETIGAYHATTYRIDVPARDPILLRTGVASPALANLHAQMGVASSVFVTACNPFGAALSDADNDLAMARLVAQLEATGVPWLAGAGVGSGGDWPPEPSVLALGIDEIEAKALCVAFAQNAVVLCDESAVPRLVLHPQGTIELQSEG